MKLPRNMGGEELGGLLGKHGYRITRQTGSHIRMTSTEKGEEHHITVPKHSPLKAGTLSGILSDVASYLKTDKKQLIEKLFG